MGSGAGKGHVVGRCGKGGEERGKSVVGRNGVFAVGGLEEVCYGEGRRRQEVGNNERKRKE